MFRVAQSTILRQPTKTKSAYVYEQYVQGSHVQEAIDSRFYSLHESVLSVVCVANLHAVVVTCRGEPAESASATVCGEHVRLRSLHATMHRCPHTF